MPEVDAVKEKPPITSIKQWLKAATSKRNLNNPAFLKETKHFLLMCEVRSEVAPIITAWEKAPITNRAIESIYKVLSDYHSTKLLAKAENAATAGNWEVRVYSYSDTQVVRSDDGTINHADTVGLIVKNKRQETIVFQAVFHTSNEAEGWANRRLCESSSESYAVIDSRTEKTKLTIYRNDAFARLEKRKVNVQTTDQVKVSKTRLSWGVGGQYNKRFYFSRG